MSVGIFPGNDLTAQKLLALVAAGGGAQQPGGPITVTATGTPQARLLADIAADTFNVLQFVSDIDRTGTIDCGAQIRVAHDAAVALGARYLFFPRGTYNAASLQDGQCGKLIFVGPGILLGAFRKHIFDLPGRQWQLPPYSVLNQQQRFRQAVAAGSATIALIGDSTTAGGEQEEIVRMRLRDEFGPLADIVRVLRCGIGGASFDDFNAPNFAATGVSTLPSFWTDPDQPVLTSIGPENPDLYLINLGQNGDTGSLFFDPAALHGTVAKIMAYTAERFGLPPDLAFQTNYLPTIDNTPYRTRINQERRLAVAGHVARYARKRGYGVIPVGRVASIRRDGLDPEDRTQIRIMSEYDQDRSFPYTFPRATRDFRTILGFGNAQDVWANGLRIQLSAREGNVALLEKDGVTAQAAVTVFAAPGIVSAPRALVAYNTASGGSLNLQVELSNGDLTILTGTTVFFRGAIDRDGGEFVPVIDLLNGATPSVHINDLLLTDEVLYMPTLTDDEQFGPLLADGEVPPTDFGNALNHMASLGQSQVLAATWAAASFR